MFDPQLVQTSQHKKMKKEKQVEIKNPSINNQSKKDKLFAEA